MPFASQNAAAAGAAVLFDSTIAGSDANFDTTGTSLAGFKELLVSVYARSAQAAVVAGMTLRFNGDAGANYDVQAVSGVGTSAPTTTSPGAGTSLFLQCTGASASANSFSACQFLVPNYLGTVAFKSCTGFWTVLDGGAPTTNNITAMFSGLWHSTAAITSLQVAGTGALLKIGSRMTVVGF